MSDANRLSNDQGEGTSERFGAIAYIAVDEANCLYKPEHNAAISISPPYGSEVCIVRDEGTWVLIRFFGKKAWSLRDNLSANLAPRREAVDVGIAPRSNHAFRSPSQSNNTLGTNVEYGPRGGRFVRTASGFRRYF